MVPPRIAGNRVFLRRLRMSDADVIAKSLQPRIYAECIPTIPHPYKLKNAKSYLEGSIREWDAGTKYDFGIVERKSGSLIGVVSLSNVNRQHMRGTVGYWVAQSNWRKGFCSEALKLLIMFAFTNLKLHRLCATAMRYNKASASLLVNHGFKKEGMHRQHNLVFGKYEDVLFFGLLRP